MTRARSEWLPGWRAGLLVLGLYAMLLQAFLAVVTPPARALIGPDPVALCVSVESSIDGGAPSHPHTGEDCICSALCHSGGGTIAGARGGVIGIERFPVLVETTVPAHSTGANQDRATPPARAPPHEAFVIIT